MSILDLVKATLICGAKRLPLPYVTGSAIADNHQGFGRVDLDAVLAPKAPAAFAFAEVSPGLQTGQLSERTISIAASHIGRLRVVLAYSDYPGHGLKNNLNLLVISPSGSRVAEPGRKEPEFAASAAQPANSELA